jgi:hypothetical protein
MPIQRRISSAPPPSHRERFAREYRAYLSRFIREQPREYVYTLEQVPIVVDKMVASLANGGAYVGPAIEAAAKACGIPPTQSAIRSYLNQDQLEKTG